MSPISTIEPIRYVTPDKVSQVLTTLMDGAHIPCTRAVAARYLDAARGDVDAACESWREDHLHWSARVVTERLPGSLEASE